jgi:uncharacterized repeat protein (TIGR01451 family)
MTPASAWPNHHQRPIPSVDSGACDRCPNDRGKRDRPSHGTVTTDDRSTENLLMTLRHRTTQAFVAASYLLASLTLLGCHSMPKSNGPITTPSADANSLASSATRVAPTIQQVAYHQEGDSPTTADSASAGTTNADTTNAVSSAAPNATQQAPAWTPWSESTLIESTGQASLAGHRISDRCAACGDAAPTTINDGSGCVACGNGACGNGACGNGACSGGGSGTCVDDGACGASGGRTFVGDGPQTIDPNEYICDGGDRWPSAVARVTDDPSGIDTEDTVVQYETLSGHKKVQPSNRVCIYAPRFAAVRRVDIAISQERRSGPETANLAQLAIVDRQLDPVGNVMKPLQLGRNRAVKGPDTFKIRDRGVPVENVEQPILTQDELAAMANLLMQPPLTVHEPIGPKTQRMALAATNWTADIGLQVTVNGVEAIEFAQEQTAEEIVVYELDGSPCLKVCKLADRHAAKSGDIVNFVIRFDNCGSQPLKNVVLLDNLTPRLEYIDESQTCSKGARFSTEANPEQSLRLRWELTDELDVGESGVVHFRCRMR